MGFSSITPNININTGREQLRTELLNTFSRLDGQLVLAPYRLFTAGGPTGNVGGAETDLFSYTLTFGTLNKTNSSILLFACGNSAANGNNKTLKVKFGSTTLATIGPFALNNGSWVIHAELVRTGASTESFWIEYHDNAGNNTIAVGTASESLAVNQSLKMTGTGTANSDTTMLYIKGSLFT